MAPDPSPVKRKVDDLAVDAEEAASVPNKKAKPNARKDTIKPKTPNKPNPPVATPVVATSSKKTPTDPPPPPVTPAATPAETPSQKDDAPSDEPEKAKRKRRKNKGKEKVADKDSAASVKSDGFVQSDNIDVVGSLMLVIGMTGVRRSCRRRLDYRKVSRRSRCITRWGLRLLLCRFQSETIARLTLCFTNLRALTVNRCCPITWISRKPLKWGW